MVNNIQSTKQFNQDLTLKICPDPTGDCSLSVPVIQSQLLNYPTTCTNFTADGNGTRQPYFGNSYSYFMGICVQWLRSACASKQFNQFLCFFWQFIVLCLLEVFRQTSLSKGCRPRSDLSKVWCFCFNTPSTIHYLGMIRWWHENGMVQRKTIYFLRSWIHQKNDY